MKQQKQQEEEKQQRREEHARKQQEYKKKQIGKWWCMKLNNMFTVMITYFYAHLVFSVFILQEVNASVILSLNAAVLSLV